MKGEASSWASQTKGNLCIKSLFRPPLFYIQNCLEASCICYCNSIVYMCTTVKYTAYTILSYHVQASLRGGGEEQGEPTGGEEA